jgi:hypothetical protein
LKSEIGNEKSKMSSLTKEKLDIESNADDLKKTIIEISEEKSRLEQESFQLILIAILFLPVVRINWISGHPFLVLKHQSFWIAK